MHGFHTETDAEQWQGNAGEIPALPGRPSNDSAPHEETADGLSRGDAALAQIESLDRLITDAESELRSRPIPRHPGIRETTQAIRVETLPCVVCHGTSAVTHYEIEGEPEKLVICDTCGLGSLLPMPDRQRIAGFSFAESTESADSFNAHRSDFGCGFIARLKLRSLLSGVPRAGRVLALGSTPMLKSLTDLGFETHTIARSPLMAASIDHRIRICIAEDLPSADFDSRAFDAAVLWHCFDRLPQPGQVLDELRRILKPGSRLIIAMPNFASWQSRTFGPDWSQLDVPRQLFQYSPENLRRLLFRHDFAFESIRHFAPKENSIGWLQSWLNRVSASPRNLLEDLLNDDANTEASARTGSVHRTLLRMSYRVGLPIAACLSIAEALRHQGGTITVTARVGNLQTVDATLRHVSSSRLSGSFA